VRPPTRRTRAARPGLDTHLDPLREGHPEGTANQERRGGIDPEVARAQCETDVRIDALALAVDDDVRPLVAAVAISLHRERVTTRAVTRWAAA
jgi:hypothetical protein